MVNDKGDTMTFNVYMGWDAREVVAYKVCEYSIKRRASVPVDIIPLKHRELREKGLFRRPWLVESDSGKWRDLIDNKPFSTEFSHTRFLVPALNNYEGWALFMDCDMVFMKDIKKLIELIDDKYAVMVVKHVYTPNAGTKMDNQTQDRYFRKNWSSFVLWNCGHPSNKKLTPAMVSTIQGGELHSFNWLKDNEIGTLGFEWNWLEGNSPVINTGEPSVIHYTNGGPWFDSCQDVLFADTWTNEYEHWQRSCGEYSELVSTKWER